MLAPRPFRFVLLFVPGLGRWQGRRVKDTFSSNLFIHRRGKRGVMDLALEDGVDVAVEGRDGIACSG